MSKLSVIIHPHEGSNKSIFDALVNATGNVDVYVLNPSNDCLKEDRIKHAESEEEARAKSNATHFLVLKSPQELVEGYDTRYINHG